MDFLRSHFLWMHLFSVAHFQSSTLRGCSSKSTQSGWLEMGIHNKWLFKKSTFRKEFKSVTHSWDQNHQNIWWSTIFFLQNFFYFIFLAWSKVELVQKILKRLGKVVLFQDKTAPQKKRWFTEKSKQKFR